MLIRKISSACNRSYRFRFTEEKITDTLNRIIEHSISRTARHFTVNITVENAEKALRLNETNQYCRRLHNDFESFFPFVKAMLHEEIFLATFCCETSCKKDFTCNTPVLQPATATKCCVASCKKK